MKVSILIALVILVLVIAIIFQAILNYKLTKNIMLAAGDWREIARDRARAGYLKTLGKEAAPVVEESFQAERPVSDEEIPPEPPKPPTMPDRK